MNLMFLLFGAFSFLMPMDNTFSEFMGTGINNPAYYVPDMIMVEYHKEFADVSTSHLFLMWKGFDITFAYRSLGELVVKGEKPDDYTDFTTNPYVLKANLHRRLSIGGMRLGIGLRTFYHRFLDYTLKGYGFDFGIVGTYKGFDYGLYLLNFLNNSLAYIQPFIYHQPFLLGGQVIYRIKNVKLGININLEGVDRENMTVRFESAYSFKSYFTLGIELLMDSHLKYYSDLAYPLRFNLLFHYRKKFISYQLFYPSMGLNLSHRIGIGVEL